MALPALLIALLAGQEAVAAGVPEPTPAEAQAATANAVQAEYTPEGAPKDDYNFVAWCHGVLSGHMALAERIQTVLPLDDAQQKIGKSYLKGYEEALAVGRKGRSPAELDAADAVRAAARANWNTAMKADLQLGADTYLAWQLPGRCEHAAKRVAGRTDLFRMIPTPMDDEGEAVGTGAALSDAPAPATALPPAPARAAAPAPDATEAVMAAVSSPEPDPVAAAPADPSIFAVGETAEPAPAAPAQPAEVDISALAGPTMLVEASDEAAADPAPAEATTVAAADAAPAEEPAAEEAKPEEAKPADRRIVRMPQKGRLFPWGKRE